MDVTTGALPCLLPKLGQLLSDEYNLTREVRQDIKFLHAELEGMQRALLKISQTPAARLGHMKKLWAREVRELSYDIEDRIDTLMLHNKSTEPSRSNPFKKFTSMSLGLLMPTKIATEIKEIKSCVKKQGECHRWYSICSVVPEPVKASFDPRLVPLYKATEDLVGIDEPRDELIKILMGKGEVPEQQAGKIVSIVGSAGLGKTTLAKQVYDKLRAQFDCCAFVSASRNPDMKELYEDMLFELDKHQYCSIREKRYNECTLRNLLGEFLRKKRYFIVIDDIWDFKVWQTVRHAFPFYNGEYRVITTTRNLETACGSAYIMKPLSLHNSRILLYRRIFGNEDEANCLDEELAEVSDKMLKRCAGLPLAIITIASVLASKGKNKMEWYNVYNSIGTGLENNQAVDTMRDIISFSYYDLPSHLKTCLLYLSMFPEDYEIDKDVLIKMWIAEGLIQRRNKYEIMFQLGERYFHELINRRLIQPMDGWNSTIVQYCRIHDMVLDLIRSLSNEENFVTILNKLHHKSPSETTRRLSLQSSNEDYGKAKANTSMQKVRSFALFPSVVNLMPPLSSFRAVRVLHLDNSCLSEGYSLEYLENLFHLRYLRLRDTGLAQLPDEIGSLWALQTLDIRGTGISMLPSTIVHLKRLMFLHIESWTRVPKGIGSLTSLQELSTVGMDNFTDIMEELGCLTELRVLGIDCVNGWDFNGLEKSLVECLNRLKKIESLYISVFGECNLDGWDTPHHLRRLEIAGCWSSTLSTWMKQPLLPHGLSSVSIEMGKLCQDDLDLLGMLPVLRFLDLEADHEDLEILGRFVIGEGLFPSLVHCVLRGSVGTVEFQQGAMPKLSTLFLTFPVREERDLGLGNLLSLRDVTISFLYGGASNGDAEKAEAMLKHAIEIHPNHPTLQIR